MKNQPLSDTQLAAKRKTLGGSEVRVWNPGEEVQPARKPQWRIKTYYAASMQHAIAEARTELGEDAIIMSSRPSPVHNRHLGEYEVVFGVGPSTAPAAPVATPTPAPRTMPLPRTVEAPAPVLPEIYQERKERSYPETNRSSLDVAGMRKQLLQIQELLNRTGVGPRLPRLPQAEEWHNRLLSVGISDDLAMQVMEQAAEDLPRFNGTQHPVRDALVDALKSNFRTDATVGVPGQRARIAVLIGPPGCGKTTTTIKLAIREGLLTQAPTTLIGFDHERISAVQQIESFSSLLGVSFKPAESIESLAQHLDDVIPGELVLIDTNGISASDLDSGRQFSEFLRSRKDVDVHLVLPANMRDADLSRTVDRFALFGPKKLLFTMIDETESFGSLLREASRTGKPLSFLSSGKHIPEDLERATSDGVAKLILHGREWRRTAGAVK